MVAKDFIDLFSKFNYGNRVAVEDFADRLNIFTVVLFMIATIIVGAKQYFLNSISCYIAVKPTGDNYNNYLTDYCWVHGTIPLRSDERMPQTPDMWEEYDRLRRITYYQWVPFVLGLQCILFYLPHIAWQAVCAHRAGGDLFSLVKAAADASISERDTRQKQVKRVAEFLEDMITTQGEVHKTSMRRRFVQKAYDVCGICVVSKRMGTCLVFSYLFIKLLTLFNAIMQIYLIQRFLGFHTDGSSGQKSLNLGRNRMQLEDPKRDIQLEGFAFGLTVVNYIRSGRDWPETLIFPRVAYCRVPGIRLVGVENTYTAQCALPINMLNEKIYIFFWFWIVFLILALFCSLVLWLIRLLIAPRRTDFIKRFLRIKRVQGPGGKKVTREDLRNFIDKFLRRDGVFLVRMLSLNAGEVITAEIVTVLYEAYIKRPIDDEDSEITVDDEKAALANNPPSYV